MTDEEKRALERFIKSIDKVSMQVDPVIDRYNKIIGCQITIIDNIGNEITINYKGRDKKVIDKGKK